MSLPTTKLDIISFGGASNLPTWLAMDTGLFAAQGLEVTLTRTEGSMPQITDMMADKYQIATTAIDNIVAYTEGQGPATLDKPFDMIAVMGVHSGLNSIVARPEIKTWQDLQGKVVAVDAPNTGYAFIIFRILERHGLHLNRDYTILPVGGTEARHEALESAKAHVAVIGQPADLQMQAAGYNILADAAAELGAYQGSVYGVRKSWAEANRQSLCAFLAAERKAHQVVHDDKAQALEVLKGRVSQLSDDKAETLYQSLTNPVSGLSRDGAIPLESVDSVLSIRAAYAEPKKQLTEPAKYIDMQYLQEAATLG